ncbi:NTP transferase domain-containing protein [Mariniphaga sp.]|uniref:nucleotidyltransferase family protein n=1 Tax=Mariniphaga sp. TaxID=1954475 RepID=UPI00356839B4
MDNIWAIILAAGASTRMKTQKLLLPWNGKTIIETVVENASKLVQSNVVVVLGSHREAISKQIKKPYLRYTVNHNFQDGMLSSVICGFRALPENADAAFICLGDQPHISPGIFRQVAEAWKTSNKGIVIPTFDGKRGHPVLIETKYKNEIEKLEPEKGLRVLSQKFAEDVHEVECGFAEILRDIDTPEDYKNELINNQ